MKPDDMRLGEERPEVELSSIGEAEGWRPSSDNLPSEEDGEKSNQSGTSSPRAVGWERVGEKGMLRFRGGGDREEEAWMGREGVVTGGEAVATRVGVGVRERERERGISLVTAT
jgi:hypothetical protein